MKKFCFMFMAILVLAFGTASSLAISFENGQPIEVKSLEPGEPDPFAVQVEKQTVAFVENGEGEDTGDVFIRWSKDASVITGCDVANVSYTNPGYSNMGVKLEMIFFDNQAYEYFGTTFRSDEEINELALQGFAKLKQGIHNSWGMDQLLMKGIVSTDQYDYPISYEDLVGILVENEYLGYSREDWLSLDEEKILKLTEYEKLMIAQFGDYKFKYGNFLSLGETGVINPGYAIERIQLHTFGDNYTLRSGKYNAQFWIVGYDASKGEYSKFGSSVPVTLHVRQNLLKKTLKQYGIQLVKRID